MSNIKKEKESTDSLRDSNCSLTDSEEGKEKEAAPV